MNKGQEYLFIEDMHQINKIETGSCRDFDSETQIESDDPYIYKTNYSQLLLALT